MNFNTKNNKNIYIISLHILVWILYITLPYLVSDKVFRKQYDLFRIIGSIIAIAYFYFNYLVLMPKFFEKKKYFLFVFLNLISIAFLYFVNIKFLIPDINLLPEVARKFIGRRNIFFNFRYISLFTLFFLASFSLRLFENWKKREQKLKDIESEQLKSELSFLKVQVNPHFLFNTLNSIYSLSVAKSGKTPNIVLKLSDLMRYMLYTSSKKMVDLKSEIEYIKNYIDLQKLRLFETVKIVFETKNSNNLHKIEPMLLIPFVENAFKYGISYTENCEINISIKVENNELILITENSVFNNKPEFAKDSHRHFSEQTQW